MSREKATCQDPECDGSCGMFLAATCKCKMCGCGKLDKETAALVEEFSHRELGA